MKTNQYLPSVLVRMLFNHASMNHLGYKHEPCDYACITRQTYGNDCANFSFDAHQVCFTCTSHSSKQHHVIGFEMPFAAIKRAFGCHMTAGNPWASAVYSLSDIPVMYSIDSKFIEAMYGHIVDKLFDIADDHDVWLYNSDNFAVKLLDAGSALEQCFVRADLDNKDLNDPEAYPWVKI